MYAIRSYYDTDYASIVGPVNFKTGPVRITSYNVCYTKLLRSLSGKTRQAKKI